jgi:tRNA(Ile2) C34 agmatinyltransferase TiaS
MDNKDLVTKYDGKFEQTDYPNSYEIDADFFCECGEHISLYVPDAYWRCKNCGRVYRARIVLEVGNEIIPNDSPTIYKLETK